MIKQTAHIPAGYKPSPLGPIPEDWEVKRLGEVVTVNSGKDYKHLSTGNIPVYGTGGYMLSVNDRLSDIDAVGIGRKGTIDKPQYLRAPFWTVDTLFFLTTKENYDLRFVFNLSQLVEWKKYSEQTGVPSLTSKSINNIQIAVPPLPEQQRIVSVLSLWDTAIAKQTALIEKLTLRKRGLMQQLLTGKKRLKGFSEEWKEVRLGDVALITMGQSPDSKYYNEIGFGLPLIQGNADIQDRKSIQRIWTSSITKTCESGDIIMSVRAPVGEIARATQKSCIGRGVCAIRNTGIKKEYLYQLLLFEEDSWKNIEQGGTFTAINSNEIKKKTLVLPTTDEQTAIASVLVNADKEIELANKKLVRMQEVKRGLMQQLLTGKRRLTI